MQYRAANKSPAKTNAPPEQNFLNSTMRAWRRRAAARAAAITVLALILQI